MYSLLWIYVFINIAVYLAFSFKRIWEYRTQWLVLQFSYLTDFMLLHFELMQPFYLKAKHKVLFTVFWALAYIFGFSKITFFQLLQVFQFFTLTANLKAQLRLTVLNFCLKDDFLGLIDLWGKWRHVRTFWGNELFLMK